MSRVEVPHGEPNSKHDFNEQMRLKDRHDKEQESKTKEQQDKERLAKRLEDLRDEVVEDVKDNDELTPINAEATIEDQGEVLAANTPAATPARPVETPKVVKEEMNTTEGTGTDKDQE